MAAQKTAQEVMDGEDAIVDAMKRFANDAKCVEDLSAFKAEAEVKIAGYKKAVVQQLREDMTERAQKQLQAIAHFEGSMGSALQQLVVKEAAASFKEKFPVDAGMQAQSFACAVKSLSGETITTADDPVSSHFTNAFASLADAAGAKPDAKGSLAERVAHAQTMKETEFKQTFMVTPQEVSEVKKLAAEAGADFDLSKLSAESAKKFDDLYASINNKVGFALPDFATKPIPSVSDSMADAYVESVNAQLANVSSQLRAARLKAFAQAFA